VKISAAAAAARVLVAANARFAIDPHFRGGVASLLRTGRVSPSPLPVGRAAAYRDLTTTSVALCGIQTDHSVAPMVNIVLSGLSVEQLFAGVDTALRAAVQLASNLGVGCRVVVLDTTRSSRRREQVAILRARYATSSLELVDLRELNGLRVSAQDVWLATHFLTAHAVHVASTIGVIHPSRVVYFVQDYEPGFVPWSTEYALARSTYHAGFHLVVNSEPVAAALRTFEGVPVNDEYVFMPSLDVGRLQALAEARDRRDGVARVAFYGRPSKPRNLYGLGVAALRLTVENIGTEAVEFISVGEAHRDVNLGHGHRLRSLGKLSWDDYFSFLTGVDVMLSLQYSPHPSHPPLEAALAGAWAITNEFEGTDRNSIHPRLIAVEASPHAIAAAVTSAIATDPGRGDLSSLDDLGQPISAVLSVLAERLTAP
jgi:hypothetical protein